MTTPLGYFPDPAPLPRLYPTVQRLPAPSPVPLDQDFDDYAENPSAGDPSDPQTGLDYAAGQRLQAKTDMSSTPKAETDRPAAVKAKPSTSPANGEHPAETKARRGQVGTVTHPADAKKAKRAGGRGASKPTGAGKKGKAGR